MKGFEQLLRLDNNAVIVITDPARALNIHAQSTSSASSRRSSQRNVWTSPRQPSRRGIPVTISSVVTVVIVKLQAFDKEHF